jgi:hypothetical protein
VLGGADIEIFTTTFAIMQSIRLDRGPAARSIPDTMHQDDPALVHGHAYQLL